MQTLRLLLRERPFVVLLFLVLALGAKALIPAGYMTVSSTTQTLTVAICADTQGAQFTRQIAVPVRGEHAPGGDHAAQTAKGTCAFSALGFSALGATDPLLLEAAIAFILLLGFAAVAAVPALGTKHRRPPLRGPPLLA